MLAFVLAAIVALVLVTSVAASHFWLVVGIAALVWIGCLAGELNDTGGGLGRSLTARVRRIARRLYAPLSARLSRPWAGSARPTH